MMKRFLRTLAHKTVLRPPSADRRHETWRRLRCPVSPAENRRRAGRRPGRKGRRPAAPSVLSREQVLTPRGREPREGPERPGPARAGRPDPSQPHITKGTVPVATITISRKEVLNISPESCPSAARSARRPGRDPGSPCNGRPAGTFGTFHNRRRGPSPPGSAGAPGWRRAAWSFFLTADPWPGPGEPMPRRRGRGVAGRCRRRSEVLADDRRRLTEGYMAG